jgi:hypothetical protein
MQKVRYNLGFNKSNIKFQIFNVFIQLTGIPLSFTILIAIDANAV